MTVGQRASRRVEDPWAARASSGRSCLVTSVNKHQQNLAGSGRVAWPGRRHAWLRWHREHDELAWPAAAANDRLVAADQ